MRYGLMYAVGHVCALLLPAWNEMPSLTPAPNPSPHASALTSRSWAARKDSARSMPLFIWSSVGGLPYMPAAISAVASSRFSSLIVLVSFRQVLFRDSGEVVAVAAVQATVDALAVHRRPQRRRQLVYRGLLGRVPESALGECYGGGPVIAAMVSLAPGSGAQVVTHRSHPIRRSEGRPMRHAPPRRACATPA